MTDGYETDFHRWTETQAGLLRARASNRIDWDHIAEEIESLGKSDRRELRSQIYRTIRHLAKLQFSQATDHRSGRRDSVRDERRQAELVLADSPSFRPQVGQIVSEQTATAIKRAIFDLGEFGEVDAATQRAPGQARYTADEVLGERLPPEPDVSATAHRA